MTTAPKRQSPNLLATELSTQSHNVAHDEEDHVVILVVGVFRKEPAYTGEMLIHWRISQPHR